MVWAASAVVRLRLRLRLRLGDTHTCRRADAKDEKSEKRGCATAMHMCFLLCVFLSSLLLRTKTASGGCGNTIEACCTTTGGSQSPYIHTLPSHRTSLSGSRRRQQLQSMLCNSNAAGATPARLTHPRSLVYYVEMRPQGSKWGMAGGSCDCTQRNADRITSWHGQIRDTTRQDTRVRN
jgi:hypothetical protein